LLPEEPAVCIWHAAGRLPLDDLSCDVLILGAGMLAALHVTTANPAARIVIAAKGLIGQSGCTRMVQGGYNGFLHTPFPPILGS